MKRSCCFARQLKSLKQIGHVLLDSVSESSGKVIFLLLIQTAILAGKGSRL